MFVRTGAWIVWVCGVCGLLVVLVAYGAFTFYQQGGAHWSRTEQIADPAARDYALRSAGQLETAYAPALLLRANERLAQLQALLEKTSASLQEKNELLNQRTAECRALQRDLEQTLAFIAQLLRDDEAESGGPARTDQPFRSTAVMRQLEEEMASLREDLAKGEFHEHGQAMELEELRNLLLQTEVEIVQMQSLAVAEFQALMAENETLATERDKLAADRDKLADDLDKLGDAARQSLVRLGAAAVPGLIDELADEQPLVRQWAATTLGELGTVAQDALPALTALLADNDATVRDAAQQALDRIAAAMPR